MHRTDGKTLNTPQNLKASYAMQDFLQSRYGHDPQRRWEHLGASCVHDCAHTLQDVKVIQCLVM